LRTLTALLTFAVVLVVTWPAVSLAWGALIHFVIGLDDREGGLAIGFAMLIAPVIAYIVAIICGLRVITPPELRSRPK
jgi:hypothetical protein